MGHNFFSTEMFVGQTRRLVLYLRYTPCHMLKQAAKNTSRRIRRKRRGLIALNVSYRRVIALKS